MQVKTPTRYHLTPVRMAINKKSTIASAGEDGEKREPLHTTGGNVNWYSYYGKQYGGLPYDLSILLLSPKKLK